MPRKKEYSEEEVLEKAMHTFWANGFESTSLRMLEKDMGINQFSIYSSFGSKHGLFVEVLKKYRSYAKTTFMEELLQSKGSLADLRKFFFDFGHAIQSGDCPKGCLIANTGMEVWEKNEDISFELNSHFTFLKETFYVQLEKIKFKEELPKDFDSEKYASFLLGSLQGLSLFARLYSKKEVDTYIDVIIEALK
ncbi:MAG: TetR/AcrR family transcriptional regulator [Maribacter sp.]|nr:TetR/AcrR family transcriptional regulator [Maribacter sp.]